MKTQNLNANEIREIIKDMQRPEETFFIKLFFTLVNLTVFPFALIGAVGGSFALFLTAGATLAAAQGMRNFLKFSREKEYKVQIAEARLAILLNRQAPSRNTKSPEEDSSSTQRIMSESPKAKTELRRPMATPVPGRRPRIEPTLDMDAIINDDRMH
jgi:hypothetical protein